MKNRSIALYSGGMDSALASFKVRDAYEEIVGAFFNVGQPGWEMQLASARRLSGWQGIPLEVFDLSSLRNNFLGLAPANNISLSLSGGGMNCPFGIFGLAASYAVARGAVALIAGVHSDDLASSPFAREYLHNVGTDAAKLHGREFKVHIPFQEVRKSDVVTYGSEVRFPFDVSRSCSTASIRHCGTCNECIKRKEAFLLARVTDSTQYENVH